MNILSAKAADNATPKQIPWVDLTAEGMTGVTAKPRIDLNTNKIADVKAVNDLSRSNIVDVLSKLRKYMSKPDMHEGNDYNIDDSEVEDSRDDDEYDSDYDTDSVADSDDPAAAADSATAHSADTDAENTDSESQEDVSHGHSNSHSFTSHLLELILSQAKKGHVTSSQMTRWMTSITWGLAHGTISHSAFDDFKEKLAHLHTAPTPDHSQTHTKQDSSACCWFG